MENAGRYVLDTSYVAMYSEFLLCEFVGMWKSSDIAGSKKNPLPKVFDSKYKLHIGDGSSFNIQVTYT